MEDTELKKANHYIKQLKEPLIRVLDYYQWKLRELTGKQTLKLSIDMKPTRDFGKQKYTFMRAFMRSQGELVTDYLETHGTFQIKALSTVREFEREATLIGYLLYNEIEEMVQNEMRVNAKVDAIFNDIFGGN